MKSRLVFLTAMVFVFCGSLAQADSRAVFVNGEQLSSQTLTALQIAYRTAIPGGHYWYDPYSGLWGREGAPAAGQIQAGLDLGGPLAEDASAGDTAVFVNGRRLPRAEVFQVMQLVGPFLPGRYWLDAQGNVGFEGGPALVNLVAASRSQASAGGGGGWNRNTPGGNWGGDDRCSYYSHPDGPSVMIGDC
jgi:hypothetical protein